MRDLDLSTVYAEIAKLAKRVQALETQEHNHDADYVDVGGDTMVQPLSLPSIWTADANAVTRGYVISRAENLVTNGSGLLNSNYNFSGLTFDPVETHGGGGSFKWVGAGGVVKLSDEYMPVDPTQYYRLSFWAKSGNVDGSSYAASNFQYVGVELSDADKLQIWPYDNGKFGFAVDTTLAVDLVPGATTMTLTDATGWHGGATAQYRHFTWYPYTNSFGYTYPNYTYSRLNSGRVPVYGGNAWANGGISGNVITLISPWPVAQGTLPAGTPVRNSVGGATYKYLVLANQTVPDVWTRYEGFIGGIDVTGSNAMNLFPYGAQYIRLLMLPNWPPTAGNTIRYSDWAFTNLSARNLESASATVPGVIDLANQQLGTGQKTVQRLVANPTGAAEIPLVVKTAPSATANAVEVQDSSGAIAHLLRASGAFTFNEGGASVNSRVEGDTDANLLFIGGVTDRIGIGTSGPGQKLDVIGRIGTTGLVIARTDLTIASGAITVTGSHHRVDTEAAAATDDLTNINGMVTGQILILYSVNSAWDVVVKHGAGNIFLDGSADFTLDNSRDMLMLICTGGEVSEIARSNNS